MLFNNALDSSQFINLILFGFSHMHILNSMNNAMVVLLRELNARLRNCILRYMFETRRFIT